MYSDIRLALLVAMPVLSAATLRVCADPNNMPFSNQQQLGFDNKLAGMLAADLKMDVSYTWVAERGSFFRKTVGAGNCDVVVGVPKGISNLATTRPYYRSSYVLVSRRDRNLDIHSLDDARLGKLKIGVHVLGDSDRGSPPAQILIAQGFVNNLVAFNIFGNLNDADPTAALIKAVEDGSVDIATAWGPMAGYFAKSAKNSLRLESIDGPSLGMPLSFDIAIGVRTSATDLEQKLDEDLERNRSRIHDLLRDYGIPVLGEEH